MNGPIEELDQELHKSIKEMKYGSITIKIQDGKIIELEITNKVRRKSQGK